GIRDFHVTGVQTCALPISISRRRGLNATAPLSASLWRWVAAGSHPERFKLLRPVVQISAEDFFLRAAKVARLLPTKITNMEEKHDQPDFQGSTAQGAARGHAERQRF